MNFKETYYDLRNIPVGILVKKVISKLRHKLIDPKKRRVDTGSENRSAVAPAISGLGKINIHNIDLSSMDKEVAEHLAGQYLDHHFDLLGSCWIEYSYNNKVGGMEGFKYNSLSIKPPDEAGIWLEEVVSDPHLQLSKTIWNVLLSKHATYKPIDWQRDNKSGFRWDAFAWYKDIREYLPPGVDKKMPWELARMQHLPQMALFARILPEKKQALILEFRSQVLDFILANPVRMGVNWATSMDVGIRVVNLLIALDLFTQIDDKNLLDVEFMQIVTNSIYDHGQHIVDNLEEKETLSNNHYVFNLAGLLFVSSYLDESPQMDNWKRFAINELVAEMKKHFYDDGGYFEGSTCYHRFVNEAMIICTSLILGNGEKDKLPEWFFKKLLASSFMLQQLTKPNNEIPQVGDNDSGRLLKLSPCGTMINWGQALAKYKNLQEIQSFGGAEDKYWDEDLLHQGPFTSSISGLFSVDDFNNYDHQFSPEISFIKELAKGQTLDVPPPKVKDPLTYGGGDHITELNYSEETIIDIPTTDGQDILEGLQIFVYPDSQLYLFRSTRLYLLVSACTNPKQYYNLSHTHNDKLSFELNIDTHNVIVDPGTYIYSPLPDRRNEFRSVKAHNGIIVDGVEQNDFIEDQRGVFRMIKKAKASMLHISERSLTLEAKYNGVRHIRKFEIHSDRISIQDHCNKKFKVNLNKLRLYSNGYGKRIY